MNYDCYHYILIWEIGVYYIMDLKGDQNICNIYPVW